MYHDLYPAQLWMSVRYPQAPEGTSIVRWNIPSQSPDAECPPTSPKTIPARASDAVGDMTRKAPGRNGGDVRTEGTLRRTVVVPHVQGHRWIGVHGVPQSVLGSDRRGHSPWARGIMVRVTEVPGLVEVAEVLYAEPPAGFVARRDELSPGARVRRPCAGCCDQGAAASERWVPGT